MTEDTSIYRDLNSFVDNSTKLGIASNTLEASRGKRKINMTMDAVGMDKQGVDGRSEDRD